MEQSLRHIVSEIKNSTQILVGITGGIGTGKSAVADIFRRQGFTVYSSDEIARELMNSHAELRKVLQEEFGTEIYTSDNNINRAVLAEVVFGDSAQHEQRLRTLNSLVHPFVIEELLKRAEKDFSEGAQCVMNETALLFEAGLEELYDYIIVVDAQLELRIERLKKRGLSREESLARMKKQMADSEKIAGADFVITNNSTESELQKSVQSLALILRFLKPQTQDDELDKQIQESNTP